MSLFFYAQEKKALVSTNTKIYRTFYCIEDQFSDPHCSEKFLRQNNGGTECKKYKR